MPGKYPTIRVTKITSRDDYSPSPYEGLREGYSLSNSDTATLNAMFPSSPIYNLAVDGYLTSAKGLLQPSAQQGDDVQFPSVDMDYTGAPDISAITDFNGIAVDSPYYPNLLVGDVAGDEGTAIGVARSPNDNFGTGGTVNTVIPSETSADIAGTTIDVSGPIGTLGQSEAFGKNEGADGNGSTP